MVKQSFWEERARTLEAECGRLMREASEAARLAEEHGIRVRELEERGKRAFALECFAETVVSRWEDFKEGRTEPLEALSLLGGALNGLERLRREPK